MKKVFIMALVAITIVTTAFAGPSSKEHFSTTFSKAKNVSWKSSDKFDKVSFVLNNEKVDAFYDLSGELLGTSKAVDFDKLPKAAIATITTKYTFPAFQVKDCILFTNANNEQNYYVSMDQANQSIVLEITKYGTVSVFSKSKK